MMRLFLPAATLGMLGLCSSALALSQLQVENAAVGQRTLVLTVDDSIKAPDLSKLQIDGYDIDNAVFVEQADDDSLIFSPNYYDLTAPGHGHTVDFVPEPGLLILDAPTDFLPQPGTVVGDTAFGGILRKVVQIDGPPQALATGQRWVLHTVQADLPDAILNCDLSFRTRVDMNLNLPDEQNTVETIGALEDSTPVSGELNYAMSGAQVLFQPRVSGHVRITGGKVEIFNFQVGGDCEVSANLRGAVNAAGDFEYEEELQARAPMMVPLGNGLFVKVQNRPSFRLEAQAKGDGVAARGDLRIVNSLRGELGFDWGQWRPLADNKASLENKTVQELTGSGQMKLMIKPKVDIFFAGAQGPSFTFESYARFVAAPGDSARIQTGPAAAGAGNKELSLGTNVYMDARTTFMGPAQSRNFLLFNHEQLMLSPPKEGALALRESDSNRVILNCETYPKADYYVIQQKLGFGAWETVVQNAAGPQVRLNLKPGTQYHFRAVGVNAMGQSLAFPPDGLAYFSKALNHPPVLALIRFPDSGAVLQDSVVNLAWRGSDEDADNQVVYTVFLDTHFPPTATAATGLLDPSLTLSNLKPGVAYYWKVSASDGTDKSETQVRSFVYQPAAQGHETGAYPMALVPKGSFRRQDGKTVTVGPVLMGKYEVTQIDFERMMGKNPSYHVRDSLPVERVTWDEADTYCREIGGRLPTEAEWEYAARAGSEASYYWGEGSPDAYAWYRGNSGNQTQKIGTKKPNAWGLHDMAGNVFEWAQDWYGEYSPNDLDHPKGALQGVAKVIRGASWYSESGNLNLSARYSNRPGFRNFKVGFRCAKDLETLSEDAPLSGSLGKAMQVVTIPIRPASAANSAAP